MLSRGVIIEINGCISTGKEAYVYHATAKDGSDRAVKVNKPPPPHDTKCLNNSTEPKLD